MKNSITNLFSKVLKVSAFAMLVSLSNAVSAKSIYMSPNVSLTANEIVRTDVWTEYMTVEGVKIEYRFADCEDSQHPYFRGQSVIFFQFTNLTSENIKMNWERESYYDNACTNCDKINSGEHSFAVDLKPKETISGDFDSFESTALYIFSNWIEATLGRTEITLTQFNFVNIQTKVWK